EYAAWSGKGRAGGTRKHFAPSAECEVRSRVHRERRPTRLRVLVREARTGRIHKRYTDRRVGHIGGEPVREGLDSGSDFGHDDRGRQLRFHQGPPRYWPGAQVDSRISF